MNINQKTINIANMIKVSEEKISIVRNTNISKTLKDKKYRENTKNIDMSDFNNIIEINIEENYIICEPYVTMEHIVDSLSKNDKSLPVITEFKDITIGGAILGCAGESSSFKYGFEHDNVLEYEIIDENGNIFIVDKNHELFTIIPGSYGTLCVLTKIKIKICDIKKNVKIYFNRCKKIDYDDMFDEKYDFIDGVIISKNSFVIMKSIFTNDESNCNFTKKEDLLFYDVVLDDNIDEIICPYKDYVFRWDRGAFWISHYAGLNDIYTSGCIDIKKDQCDLLSTNSLYAMTMKRDIYKRESSYIVQDITIPINNSNIFELFIDSELHIYPVWMCPIYNNNNSNKFVSENIGKYINFGIYGPVENTNNDFICANKKIEEIAMQLLGKKCLYGQSYYTENDFYSIYPKMISKKFISLYDKSCEFYKSLNVK